MLTELVIGNRSFDTNHIIVWLAIGLIAGFLAGRVVDGGGFGVIGDMVVGLAGALVGGWIIGNFTGTTEADSFVGECIVAFIGAVVLLALVRALSGGGRRARWGGRRRPS